MESLAILNLPRLQKLLHTLLKCYRHASKITPSNVQIQKTGAEAGLYTEIYARFLSGALDVLKPPRRQPQPKTIAPMEIRLRPGMGQGPVADPLAHLLDHRRQADLQGKTCHPGVLPTGHLA